MTWWTVPRYYCDIAIPFYGTSTDQFTVLLVPQYLKYRCSIARNQLTTTTVATLFAPFERVHLKLSASETGVLCYASPVPMDTTQNASTVISLLIDTVKYSITLYLFHFTYLLTYSFIYLQSSAAPRYYRVPQYIPWRKIVYIAQH